MDSGGTDVERESLSDFENGMEREGVDISKLSEIKLRIIRSDRSDHVHHGLVLPRSSPVQSESSNSTQLEFSSYTPVWTGATRSQRANENI